MVRGLSNSRGPWAPIEWEGNTPTKVADELTFWKLDTCETASRMRILMKCNYDFDDHSSALKDVSEVSTKKRAFHSSDVSWSQFIMKEQEAEDEEDKSEERTVSDSRKEMQQLMDTNAKMENTDQNKIYRTDCQMIKPMQVLDGILEISQESVSFYALNVKDAVSIEKKYSENKKWTVHEIVDVQTRNYLHEKTALEIFFSNHKAYFLNFVGGDRKQVYKRIVDVKPANLAAHHFSAFTFGVPSPSSLLKKLGVTERWRKRKMSNFEYLMALNTIAGRTYNDLSQYPVFPWVLSNYSSQTLDLTNPANYRDLSKPVGALNPDRLQSFVERYNNFEDPVIPKFHYGKCPKKRRIIFFNSKL